MSFLVRATIGLTNTKKLLIKCQQKFAKLIKAHTSFTFFRYSQSIIVQILFKSIQILLVDITYPRYVTLDLWNLLLSTLSCKPASSIALSTRRTCRLCSARVLEYTSILLIYAVQNRSKQSQRALFTQCQNVLRALASPKGITRYSKSLYQVQNAVNHLSPLAIRSLLKAAIILNFEQNLALLNLLRVSQSKGIRYQFLIVKAFNLQQLTQNQSPPSSFFTKITRDATGKELAQINPFSKLLLRYF